MHIKESNLVYSVKLVYDKQTNTLSLSTAEELPRPPCRAFRLANDSKRFLFLKVPSQFPREHMRSLSDWLDGAAKDGLYCDSNEGQMKFTLLGCTESGIRSGHLIFFNEDADVDVTRLLINFGQLGDVYEHSGAGKYAARMGLSFTSTLPAINVLNGQMKCIEDVYAEDGKCTTDGCSPIRESYAKQIRDELSIPSNTSVFHIRRGGIKGLLVAYPDEVFDARWRNAVQEGHSRLAKAPDTVLAYRPSMLKYNGGTTEIEVHGVSESPDSARLNFQFIILLLKLGVDRTAFDELLKAHLREIGALTMDREVALLYLKGELDAQGKGSYQDIVEMLYAGHSMDEPYLHRQLGLYQNNQHVKLKKKLNIKVPRSCYLYGVVDELGVLGEDEVFINLPYREGPINSDVLVIRNPAYKPTDVRRLKAVYKSELSFLRNCIVFPLRSRHSIPHSLASGDLDGDKYFVSWETTILPEGTEYTPPAVHLPGPERSRTTSLRTSRGVQTTNAGGVYSNKAINEDLMKIFLEQHYGTVLGLGSNEWKGLAEHYDDEVTWSYCMILADIIQEALEIVKNGGDYRRLNDRLFSLRNRYKREEEVERRASLVKPLDALRSHIPIMETAETPKYTPDPALSLEHVDPQKWLGFYDEGIAIMREFNRGLRDAIAEEENEGPGLNWNSRQGSGRHPSLTDCVKQTYLDRYFPNSPGLLSQGNTDNFIRASAWYSLGYAQNRPAFAWLGARFLNHIKAYETTGGRPGFVIGALKEIDGTAVLPSYQDSPTCSMSSEPSLPGIFENLHL